MLFFDILKLSFAHSLVKIDKTVELSFLLHDTGSNAPSLRHMYGHLVRRHEKVKSDVMFRVLLIALIDFART